MGQGLKGKGKQGAAGAKDLALFQSMAKWDVDGVARALAAGASPNAEGGDPSRGALPVLAYAVEFADVWGNGRRMEAAEAICEALIKAGARVGHPSGNDGFTALHRACAGLMLPLVKVLLAAGADPNAMSRAKYSPLSMALSPASSRSGVGMAKTGVVLELLRAGADRGQRDAHGRQADYCAPEGFMAHVESELERERLELSLPEAGKSKPSPSL